MNMNDNKARRDNLIDHAIKYTKIGLSVIPLGPITKGIDNKKIIKYPLPWKKYQSVIATKDEITGWSNFDNLGIVTGKISGVLVLDADTYKPTFDKDLFSSIAIPITPMQETASGGKQYFFKLPKDKVIKNDVCIGHKSSGIDIRGDGGMVIVAPTITSYGEYNWIVSPEDEPFADIPPNLMTLLSGHFSQEPSRKRLSELVGLKEGEGRNNAMASFIGGLLNSRNIDRWDSEVWPMAQALNKTNLPPLEDDELQSVYRSITKIETERRRNGIRNGKEKQTEKKDYTPALPHQELMTKVFPPARYTIDPFFEQGTVNMVSAPPNTWKSWLLFLFANHIASGTPVLEQFMTEKACVMIVNEEDSLRLIQDRIRLLKIEDTSIQIFYRVAQGSKLTEEFVDALINEAKEKNAGVIMFDSLRSIHEADENDSTSMQGVMDLLKRIARENITVIFTHHNRKKSMFGKGDDAESIRGSSAINAAVSGHISLEEVAGDTGTSLVVKHLKSKVGEKLKPFDISVNVADDSVSFGYLGEHSVKEEALTQAKEKILESLTSRKELLSRKDLVHMQIAGNSTIIKATKSLVSEGLIKMMSRKETLRLGLKSFSSGKPNEKLYQITTEENEDINTTDDIWPSYEEALPANDLWTQEDM